GARSGSRPRLRVRSAGQLRSRALSPRIGAMTALDASAPSIGDQARQTRAGVRLRQIVAGANAWAETRLDAERDQLPLWIPVGLGIGIAAWFILPDARTWTAFILAAAGLG